MKKEVRLAGRPAGNDSTRAAILQHARNAFAASGYNGTSIRAVAAVAGVDPSTVLHFFSTKEGLFQAVVKDVAEAMPPLLDALRGQVGGTELVRIYLDIWENEEAGAAMRAIVRTSIGSDTAMELFRETITRSVIDAAVGATASPLDAELVMMQLISLGLGRYIVQLPELAEGDINSIAARVGPILDSYLSPQP